jgi:hypothetical protein
VGFRGTCHCGRFVFEVHGVAADQDGLIRVPRDRLRLLSTEEGVGAYTFGRRTIGHRFCGACGTHLYGEDIGGAGPGTVYVNPRCVVRGDQTPALVGAG